MQVLMLVLQSDNKANQFRSKVIWKSWENMFNNRMLFLKKNQAGLHHTENPVGDAPKPQSQAKPIKKQNQSNNQHPVNQLYS